ncbi:MAG: N-acetyltransferase family protein [Kofleriaceae bacterium]
MTTIRFATPDDAPAIASIVVPLIRDTAINFHDEPPAAAALASRIEAGQATHPWLVAVQGDAVVGYALSREFGTMAGERWTTEVGLSIASGLRASGIGSRLYAALFSVLEAQGYRTLVAFITVPNEASARLHLRFGFRKAGVLERSGWKLDRWHDTGWWQKLVGEPSAPTPIRPSHELAHMLAR